MESTVSLVMLCIILATCKGEKALNGTQKEVDQSSPSSMDEDVRMQLHLLLIKVNHMQAEIDKLKLWNNISSSYCQVSGMDKQCGECRCIDDFERRNKHYCDCQQLEPQRDCLEFFKSGHKVDGVYRITQNNHKTILVYCDQTTDGGGWTVFQRRMNGAVDFNVDWEAYKHGFGRVQGEFWLGNDNIFIMALQGLYPKCSELRIDMIDWNLKKYFIKYDNFRVDNEHNGYKMTIGKQIAGNTGNGLTMVQNSKGGVKFSTYDSDNDSHSSGNCAQIYRGGWWFANCHAGNLNGVYHRVHEKVEYAQGVCWTGISSPHYSMKGSEMKIRRKI